MTDQSVSASPQTGPTPYDNAFYERLQEGTLRSAEAIVPIVVSWIRPRSVVDVGCGRGAWLSVFKRHGVESIAGIDGGYVDRKKLLVPEECFSPADLSAPLHREETFDLALCLEVAEHLSWRHAPNLIASLASLAPLVVFSAAVPGQSGVQHVNAQWPRYWVHLFADQGLRCLDVLR